MESQDSAKQKVSWRPLRRGGTSWRTHKVEQQDEVLTVVPTRGEKFVGWAIMLAAFVTLSFIMPHLFSIGKTAGAIFALIAAPLFGLMGFAMVKSVKTITFDLFKGVYYQGKQYDPIEAELAKPKKKPFFRITEYGDDTSIQEQAHGRLRDIEALQVIAETIRNRSKSRTRSFTSYELNLVLHDGKRLNVMDHGNREKFDQDTEQISQFLNLPVWHADKK